MKIGIDFDNTIVNTSETSKKYLDKYKPGNDLKSYHELSDEEEFYFFEKYYEEITNNLEVFENVKETFKFLKDNNFKLVLITARGGNIPEMINVTKRFLEKKDIVFDEMIFDVFPKGKEAKENNLDLVIDDTKEVIDDVRKNGVKGLLYGSDVKNWKEVEDYIRKEFLCQE